MDRLFFDIKSGDLRTHDFKGFVCQSLEQARTMAELLSLDLACSGSEEWTGALVEVFNVHGQRLLSTPVPQFEQVAA
jgi:Domain of unknown function (DUF6894)